MPWVTVKDFDRDVKVGDRIRIVYPLAERVHEGIAKWIGERNIINMSNGVECCSSRHLSTDGLWQVWREPKRWKSEPAGEYYIMNAFLDITTMQDLNDYDDNRQHTSYNYWRLISQAQEYADECKKLAERLHDKYNE